MAGLRLTGLVSGFDTESMVKELVKASSTKVEEAKKEKQKIEWKKEAWTDLNTKILNFYKTSLTAFKTNGSYSAKSATSSDSSVVSATATSKASNGTHQISVKQLAQSAYLTSGSLKGTKEYETNKNASNSTSFDDLITQINGELTIDSGFDQIVLNLGEDVKNVNELNQKLASTVEFKGLRADVVNGKLTFINETKTDDGGKVFNIKSDVLGIDGDISYETDKNKLESSQLMQYKTTFSGNDITNETKLTDLGIKVGTTFKINDVEFTVDNDSKISDLTDKFKTANVNAQFDETQKRFYINSLQSGKDNDFTITSNDNEALEILGLGSTATKIDGKNSIIEYNGVDYENNNNTLQLNGLTFTAHQTTGDYNEETKEFKNDKKITINVNTDTTTMYDTVKNFVKSYNELIEELNTVYKEEKTDYEPLSEDERAQISDKEAEKWETQAKKGLLRRDETIGSLLSQMRSMLNGSIEVTNDDGTTSKYSLSALGITTGSYTENGKLHIMGDPDDPLYADQPNKLKQMLESKPEIFSQVFAGTKDKPGFGTKMYSYLSDSMKYRAGVRSTQTLFNNLSIDKEIKDWEEKIDDYNEKLLKVEDKYYKQFSAMEAIMAKMQSQQSYISQLMGGM